ncbi:nuclease EXOG, mitochondrial [Amia ocellicauda]|uniref:nuclease EXOG, mitochondrial n=1 Tax=Amia ocellicauda TaxID=2972642 RepID=UPI0034640355
MASRVRWFRSRFVGGFVLGAAVSAASCVTCVKLYLQDIRDTESPEHSEEPAYTDLGRFGFPLTGAEIRQYTSHALSYDQVKRTPRWVAEHLSKEKLLGKADRKHCKFKPDPRVPALFTAVNEDYLHSGWSRGHMAPAGDNKHSEQSMMETFYLSNIVPQNFENNAGFWNRLEMYCRELTKRFDDVWIVSGPLALPEVGPDGKKTVSYKVIGQDDVAVPTHLYKVVLVQRNQSSFAPLALGAFVVPNRPIGFDHPLTRFQVGLEDLEKISGLTFFPKLERPVQSLCEADTCRLMDFREFTLYITGRKVSGARTLPRLEKFMSELKEAGIEPDDYLLRLYEEKRRELGSAAARESKSG